MVVQAREAETGGFLGKAALLCSELLFGKRLCLQKNKVEYTCGMTTKSPTQFYMRTHEHTHRHKIF